jgi:type IV pilus assembly protein PilA
MKKTNNSGFSLVELIIVVAIMAVLVGVMAPQFAKYLDKTKYTKDCAALGIVLDACEVIGADPESVWASGDANKITITIGSSGTTYSGGASAELDTYVPASTVKLEGPSWGPFVIYATKESTGFVKFDISNNAQIAQIRKYSGAMADRLH